MPRHRSMIRAPQGSGTEARAPSLRLIGLWFFLFLSVASAATLTSFDAPGAGTGLTQGTLAQSINTAGTVTGYSIDANYVLHGFVRTASGVITTFDAPGAGTNSNQGTAAVSVNASGATTGWFIDSSGVYHGFVRAADGAITTFDAPGAGTGYQEGTQPSAMNEAGAIIGFYFYFQAGSGFLRHPNGKIESLDAAPVSINAHGVVTGSYGAHGFVRASNGTMTLFDAPGATATMPQSINRNGAVAGYFVDAANNRRGFVRYANGAITIFAPQDQASAYAINDRGTIAGTIEVPRKYYGFVRASGGAITSFDAPAAARSHNLGTRALSINLLGATTGYFDEITGEHVVFHGFVRTR